MPVRLLSPPLMARHLHAPSSCLVPHSYPGPPYVFSLSAGGRARPRTLSLVSGVFGWSLYFRVWCPGVPVTFLYLTGFAVPPPKTWRLTRTAATRGSLPPLPRAGLWYVKLGLEGTPRVQTTTVTCSFPVRFPWHANLFPITQLQSRAIA